MKRILLLILFCTGISTLITAQAPTWIWAKKGGGANFDNASGVYAAGGNNIYYCGSFYLSGQFGNVTLTSGGGDDGFICKYKNNGSFKWVRQCTGTMSNAFSKVVTDNAGNVYATGYYEGTMTIGLLSITSVGSTDLFLAKFDTNGNILWLQSAGGTMDDHTYDLTVDNTGNIIYTGIFKNNFTIGGNTLTSATSNYDLFVAKYNSAGVLQWVSQTIGSATSFASAYGLVADASNNLYIAGQFNGSAQFGGTTVSGTYNDFFAKLNSAGSWQWAIDAANNPSGTMQDICVDASGNIYVTGYFGYSVTGCISLSGLNICTTGSFSNVYTAKYNSTPTIQWVKTGGASNFQDYSQAMTCTSDGDVFVTGWVGNNNAVFGPFTLNSPHPGYQDIFVIEYDTNGNEVWATVAGGTQPDEAHDISREAETGDLYLAGFYSKKAYYGPILLSGGTNGNAWLGRLQDPNPRLSNPTFLYTDLNVLPNPASEMIQFKTEIEGNLHIKIYAMNGILVYENEFYAVANDKIICPISQLASGTYMVRVEQNESLMLGKFIKQ